MNRKVNIVVLTSTALLIPAVGIVVANDYDIDWHSCDAGDPMWSAAGAYELGGSIGQHE